MKIRKGFVSNSSSSSFICEVCSNVESGMDVGLSDFDMFSCKNGHTVCNSHAINNYDDFHDDDYEVPAIHCPICQMTAVSDDMMRKYLLKKLGKSDALVVAEIAQEFPTFEDFTTFTK